MAALNLYVRHLLLWKGRVTNTYAIRVVTHSHIIRFSFLLRNVRSAEIQMLNSNFEYKSVNEVDSVDVNVNQCTHTLTLARTTQTTKSKSKRKKKKNTKSHFHCRRWWCELWTGRREKHCSVFIQPKIMSLTFQWDCNLSVRFSLFRFSHQKYYIHRILRTAPMCCETSCVCVCWCGEWLAGDRNKCD